MKTEPEKVVGLSQECNICHHCFPNDEDLESHKQGLHIVPGSKLKDDDCKSDNLEIEEVNSYICNVCDCNFSSDEKLVCHQKFAHIGAIKGLENARRLTYEYFCAKRKERHRRYKCDCGKAYFHSKDLMRHKRQSHPNGKQFSLKRKCSLLCMLAMCICLTMYL